MFCEKCGTKLPEGSRFCMNCGAKAAVAETPQEAAQEAAVSVDSPVLEAGPVIVEQDSVEIAEEKPSLPQGIAAGTDTVQPSYIKATPEQAMAGQPMIGQPTIGQLEQRTQAPQQQPATQTVSARQTVAATQSTTASQPSAAARQYTTARPTTPQAPAGTSAQPAADTRQSAQPAIPFQPASAQQAESALKPEKIKPLQTWKFIGMLIITAIPVINLIMVLVWSFSGGFNKNTRNFARATLILWIIGLLLLLVTAIVNWALIQYIWTSFSSLPTGITP